MGRLLTDFRLDCRQAFRSLSHSRAYAAAVILLLALGIGTTTALFSVLEGVVFASLPYPDGDRLGRLSFYNQETKHDTAVFSKQEFLALESQLRSFSKIAALARLRCTLRGQFGTEVIAVGAVSDNYLDLLGAQPIAGNLFRAGDDATPSIVLSNRAFVSIFHGDLAIIGQAVRLNDRLFTVTGILPALPEYPEHLDVFVPLVSARKDLGIDDNPTTPGLMLFGRLAAGRSWKEANAELRIMSRAFRSAGMRAYPSHEFWGIDARPVADEMASQSRPTLVLLFCATSLVLLIACSNVANLALARGLKRRREFAVQASLGAGKGRLLRQLIVEGCLLSSLGAALGLLLTSELLALLTFFIDRISPRAYEVTVNTPVLLFCACCALVTGIVACSLPAWRLPNDLTEALKSGGRGTTGTAHRGLQRILIAVQVCVALVLTFGSGALLRSFIDYTTTNPGFRSENVLVMQISTNYHRSGIDEYRRFFDQILDRIQSLPGVLSGAVCSRTPLDHQAARPHDFQIEFQQPAPEAARPTFDLFVVSPHYFDTLGVPILKGRAFRPTDRSGAAQVAIVSQNMAQHRWPNEDVVGRRISLDGGATYTTIVGVAGNLKFSTLSQGASEGLYLPFSQFPLGNTVILRTTAAPVTIRNSLRAIVEAADPESGIYDVQLLQTIVSNDLTVPRLTTALVSILSGLMLIVTTAGVAAVSVLTTGERRVEIGVRIAVGALPRQVITLLLRQQMTTVAAGLVLGAATSLAIRSMLQPFLFGLQTPGLAFLFLAIAVMTAACAGACYFSVRRMASIDPNLALKAE